MESPNNGEDRINKSNENILESSIISELRTAEGVGSMDGETPNVTISLMGISTPELDSPNRKESEEIDQPCNSSHDEDRIDESNGNILDLSILSELRTAERVGSTNGENITINLMGFATPRKERQDKPCNSSRDDEDRIMSNRNILDFSIISELTTAGGDDSLDEGGEKPSVLMDILTTDSGSSSNFRKKPQDIDQPCNSSRGYVDKISLDVKSNENILDLSIISDLKTAEGDGTNVDTMVKSNEHILDFSLISELKTEGEDGETPNFVLCEEILNFPNKDEERFDKSNENILESSIISERTAEGVGSMDGETPNVTMNLIGYGLGSPSYFRKDSEDIDQPCNSSRGDDKMVNSNENILDFSLISDLKTAEGVGINDDKMVKSNENILESSIVSELAEGDGTTEGEPPKASIDLIGIGTPELGSPSYPQDIDQPCNSLRDDFDKIVTSNENIFKSSILCELRTAEGDCTNVDKMIKSNENILESSIVSELAEGDGTTEGESPKATINLVGIGTPAPSYPQDIDQPCNSLRDDFDKIVTSNENILESSILSELRTAGGDCTMGGETPNVTMNLMGLTTPDCPDFSSTSNFRRCPRDVEKYGNSTQCDVDTMIKSNDNILDLSIISELRTEGDGTMDTTINLMGIATPEFGSSSSFRKDPQDTDQPCNSSRVIKMVKSNVNILDFSIISELSTAEGDGIGETPNATFNLMGIVSPELSSSSYSRNEPQDNDNSSRRDDKMVNENILESPITTDCNNSPTNMECPGPSDADDGSPCNNCSPSTGLPTLAALMQRIDEIYRYVSPERDLSKLRYDCYSNDPDNEEPTSPVPKDNPVSLKLDGDPSIAHVNESESQVQALSITQTIERVESDDSDKEFTAEGEIEATNRSQGSPVSHRTFDNGLHMEKSVGRKRKLSFESDMGSDTSDTPSVSDMPKSTLTLLKQMKNIGKLEPPSIKFGTFRKKGIPSKLSQPLKATASTQSTSTGVEDARSTQNASRAVTAGTTGRKFIPPIAASSPIAIQQPRTPTQNRRSLNNVKSSGYGRPRNLSTSVLNDSIMNTTRILEPQPSPRANMSPRIPPSPIRQRSSSVPPSPVRQRASSVPPSPSRQGESDIQPPKIGDTRRSLKTAVDLSKFKKMPGFGFGGTTRLPLSKENRPKLIFDSKK